MGTVNPKVSGRMTGGAFFLEPAASLEPANDRPKVRQPDAFQWPTPASIEVLMEETGYAPPGIRGRIDIVHIRTRVVEKGVLSARIDMHFARETILLNSSLEAVHLVDRYPGVFLRPMNRSGQRIFLMGSSGSGISP